MLDWWSKYFASIETLTEVSNRGTAEPFYILSQLWGQPKFVKEESGSCFALLFLLRQALKAQEAALSDSEDKDDVDIADGGGKTR